MKTLSKIVSLFVVVFSLEACVSTRVIQQRKDGSSTEVVGNFLLPGSANALLQTSARGNNEAAALEVADRNGIPISISDTNLDGTSGNTTVGYTGYGAYGYGAGGAYGEANARYGVQNAYSSAIDRLDAAPPLQANSAGAVDNARVTRVEQELVEVREDVDTLGKGIGRQHRAAKAPVQVPVVVEE